MRCGTACDSADPELNLSRRHAGFRQEVGEYRPQLGWVGLDDRRLLESAAENDLVGDRRAEDLEGFADEAAQIDLLRPHPSAWIGGSTGRTPPSDEG